MSPFIKEKKDYFVGIYDRTGRMVASHISASGPGMITPILQAYPLESMRPGDAYWFNDPYLSDGAVQHHQDMVFSTPVFHDGAVIAFTVTFGHYQDIGGARAGSISPHSTEIYHEGILVPPVRIMREGRLNEEAYRIFLRNSRMPDMVEGDTRAMMASCRLADTRVTELLARYGAATVLAAFELCLEQTAARARQLFLDLVPHGSWAFHDFLDGDGSVASRPFRVALTLTRTGDHVTLDGTASDDQARGPVNYTTNAGLMRIHLARYLQMLDPDLEVNEGLLQNLDEWVVREGTIIKPRFPAPVGMRANTMFRVLSCVFGTLAQSNGGQVPAASPVYVLYYFRAWDDAHRRPILCIEGLGVGLGARPFADGVDVIYYIGQENYPVEYVEREFPLRVERYAVRPDSGGPGLHRGGTGVVRDVRVMCERAELATRMENTLVAPYGVAGGRAGRTGRVVLNPGTPAERVLPGQGDGIVLERGDLFRLETCGGGGWGDPLTRDPMRVREDVARGFVTVRGAREDYGVVLDPVTLAVDKSATDDERGRRAAPLALIDRGPGFAEAERLVAGWRRATSSRHRQGGRDANGHVPGVRGHAARPGYRGDLVQPAGAPERHDGPRQAGPGRDAAPGADGRCRSRRDLHGPGARVLRRRRHQRPAARVRRGFGARARHSPRAHGCDRHLRGAARDLPAVERGGAEPGQAHDRRRQRSGHPDRLLAGARVRLSHRVHGGPARQRHPALRLAARRGRAVSAPADARRRQDDGLPDAKANRLGQAALELGLVHEVVEPDALMTRAMDLGRELAEGPQVAMRLLKRSIYNAAELTFAQALDEIAAKTAVSDHHPDAIEGMQAFKEKRAPRFNQAVRQKP